MDALVGLPVGLALSTAAGLRVFIPLLLVAAAAHLGYLRLTPSMTWIGSDAAVLAFATATLVEIGAYYVPWLDNLLDTIAAPAAVTAGVISMAAVTPELSPLMRWTLAVLIGGGAAGVVHGSTALLRLKSSAFTAGLGNAGIATGELLGSLALGLLGLIAPLVAVAVVVLLLVAVTRRFMARRDTRPPAGLV